MTTSQGISYAEAVKRVWVQSKRPKEKETQGITKSACDACAKIKEDSRQKRFYLVYCRYDQLYSAN